VNANVYGIWKVFLGESPVNLLESLAEENNLCCDLELFQDQQSVKVSSVTIDEKLFSFIEDNHSQHSDIKFVMLDEVIDARRSRDDHMLRKDDYRFNEGRSSGKKRTQTSKLIICTRSLWDYQLYPNSRIPSKAERSSMKLCSKFICRGKNKDLGKG
jgi:hypothetical protein